MGVPATTSRADMSWKVLVTARTLNVEAVGRAALDLLAGAGCELIHPPKCGPLPAEELLPLLPGMDAVFASMDRFTADVLASPEASSLKLISRWGVGYDAIDIPAMTKAKIPVMIAGTANSPSVAEQAMTYIPIACGAAIVLAIPIAWMVARRIESHTRRAA